MTNEAERLFHQIVAEKLMACEPNIPRHLLYADLAHLLLKQLTDGTACTGFGSPIQPILKTSLRAPTIFNEMLVQIKNLKLSQEEESVFLGRILVTVSMRIRDHFAAEWAKQATPAVPASAA